MPWFKGQMVDVMKIMTIEDSMFREVFGPIPYFFFDWSMLPFLPSSLFTCLPTSIGKALEYLSRCSVVRKAMKEAIDECKPGKKLFSLSKMGRLVHHQFISNSLLNVSAKLC